MVGSQRNEAISKASLLAPLCSNVTDCCPFLNDGVVILQDVDEEVHKLRSEDEEENDPDSDEDGGGQEEEEPKEPKIRETPEDISFDAIVNTLAFHPKQDIIAAGDIDGDIYL